MRIDRNCWGVVLTVYALFIVIDFVLIAFVPVRWIVYPFVAASIWACAWQTFFHTVPSRTRRSSSTLVSSVADGRVLIIDKVFESEFLNKECIQVSVYMNFFDVHANYWPVDGTVVYSEHIEGAHLYANNPKSSLLNEHSCVCVENSNGSQVLFKQVAGGFARRVLTYARVGDKACAGSQCGMIKFGSRIDMFLPLDSQILVKVGDMVRASETLIAKIG